MTLDWRAILLGVLISGATALGAQPLTPGTTAEFAYDLGPDKIDTSKYPVYQQQSYELFTHACSVCHTPARAINSPYITTAEWIHYVSEMHLRAQQQLLTPEDNRRLVDFLAFDARQRKVKNKKAFTALQKKLAARFAEIHAPTPSK